MSFSYIVLGAGRQGTASAYDLAKFGDAARVTLADVDGERARASAERVNRLTGTALAEAMALDVRDLDAVKRAMRDHTVALSAVPYFFNLDLTRAAIEAGVSFCDLGGHTDVVRSQHALDPDAKRAGVRVVPDCGMGPGMGNTLGVYAMSLLDTAEHVYLYDGGIPQDPRPPWNYALTFNIEGLTNEYSGGMTILHNGELVHMPCFVEPEMIDFPPIGALEAFMVAGGVSTAPWTFKGRLKTYQIKIVRWPGAFAQLKAFSDLGLFDLKPVTVDGIQMIPRHVFHALFEPQVRAEGVKDVCLIRARAVGAKSGRPTEAIVDVIDYYDEATGFSAMERTTGWHAAIVALMMARGETPVGSIPLEIAVPGDAFVNEARKRGFNITERINTYSLVT
ncbi:MAG TPA: saccharopine dehydrogenase C-terminal domain-containing protein [Anaerolineae bacterium]|nr:saccharopine dehydrogenase C-terminal domain-containing protein [Anaerolineae bacterium]